MILSFKILSLFIKKKIDGLFQLLYRRLMKNKLFLILFVIISFYSCQSYFGKKTYTKLKEQLSEEKQSNLLNTKGYYSFQDSAYHYYNFKRKGIINLEIKPQDSVKLIYSNFIILNNDNTGYINLTTRWDGLHHSGFDSSVLASGTNSKDSAHVQFLKWARLNRLLDGKSKKSRYSSFYQTKNDSIFINYFQYMVDGKSTLHELKGPIIDESTFKITSQKRYKTGRFGKTKTYKISMMFKFEKILTTNSSDD